RPLGVPLVWGDRITKRVMTKVALKLLAYFCPNDVCQPELEAARRFARYDDGDESDFRAGFDGFTDGAGLPHVEEPLFHGIDIWTHHHKFHYRMTLFGEVRFVGTLTTAWSGLPVSAGYTFDIRNPATHTLDYQPRDGAALVNKTRRVR